VLFETDFLRVPTRLFQSVDETNAVRIFETVSRCSYLDQDFSWIVVNLGFGFGAKFDKSGVNLVDEHR